MTVQFEKATRRKAKARIALSGPSGAGKTYSGLEIATGLAGDGLIAVIDTERDSAQLYADEFDFVVATIDAPHDPSKYVDAIRTAAESGASVLLIDSLSHAWQRVLEIVDQEKANSRNPHQLAAWAVASPMWRGLLDAILQAPLHVITTLRSKTEWAVGENNKPEKIGLAPEARAGIEYEFTVFGEINHRHFLQITKSRVKQFQDQSIERPDRRFGKAIVEWLNEGEEKPLPEWLDDLCNEFGEGETLDAINGFRVESGRKPVDSIADQKIWVASPERVEMLRAKLSGVEEGSSAAEEAVSPSSDGNEPQEDASSSPPDPDPAELARRLAERHGGTPAEEVTGEDRASTEASAEVGPSPEPQPEEVTA